jgi:hypothetical protein
VGAHAGHAGGLRLQRAAADRQVVPEGYRRPQAALQRVLRPGPRAVAHAWGGHTVEENQKWSLEFIAAMAKSRIARSDEVMQ